MSVTHEANVAVMMQMQKAAITGDQVAKTYQNRVR